MYKRNLLLILVLILTFINVDAFAARKAISMMGHWSDKILRSSISTEPEVTIDDTTLKIYFPTALDNVLISICDKNGNLVFEESVSVGAMETYSVNLIENKYYYIKLSHIEKIYPNFISILDLYKDAMEWADINLDETENSYNTWKKMYGDYLYFPEYKEDYGAYIPISKKTIAAVSNISGKVVVGDQIVDMKDIFSYEDLQLKGCDAYYSNRIQV